MADRTTGEMQAEKAIIAMTSIDRMIKPAVDTPILTEEGELTEISERL